MSLLHSSCISHNVSHSIVTFTSHIFITNTSWHVTYSMDVRPPALLQHRIGQLYQHAIGTGVLVGSMPAMGMLFFIKQSSPIEPKFIQQSPFALLHIATQDLLQHPVMLLNPFIYIINGPEIHVGVSAPASFFLWVPPR